MNLSIATTIGPLYDRTPVLLQAGEAFTLALTLPDSAAGAIALRFWRRGNAEIVHTVEVDGGATGEYELTVPGTVTKYLDGDYYWSLWWIPDTGDQVCLMPASSMLVHVSGGVANSSVDGYVTQTELEEILAGYVEKT